MVNISGHSSSNKGEMRTSDRDESFVDRKPEETSRNSEREAQLAVQKSIWNLTTPWTDSLEIELLRTSKG
jgi:hypothetical protein